MKIKNKKFLFFLFLMILGIALTLYVEYKFQYFQFKWLGLRVLIISAAVVQYGTLSSKFKKKAAPYVITLFISSILLYIVNFLANSINVYHLDRFSQINNFCTTYAGICETISVNFYRFKVYRFVSLTSYFFFYIIFLLIGLTFSDRVSRQTDKIWQKMPKVKLKYAWFFYFFLTYLIFQQMVSVFAIMSKNSVKMIYTLKYPFEERWEPVMGGRFSFGWIKTYSDFVNSQVPQQATILIPDQTAPWEMEGNPFYIRWFFYPRSTIQMTEADTIPLGTDYILISDGVFGHEKKIFPTFKIKKEIIEKIILVNKDSLNTTVLDDVDFIPSEFSGKWGVIKLK